MDRTLDICIVNWNAGAQLRECLESIRAAAKDGFVLNRVVVVDNASVDGSLEALECAGIPLELMRNAENRGFGAACNQGVEGSGAEYLLFLNPDTRLFENSLSVPIRYMGMPGNSKTAVCGIQLIEDDGSIGRTCARFPRPRHFLAKATGLDRIAPRLFKSHVMTEWDHAASRRVDHVIGAFYLIRREVFEKLGGFDGRFFLYLEDLDLSSRVCGHGRHIMYLADAQAYHKGGGVSDQAKAARLFYSVRSRILYGFKHFSILSAALLFAVSMLIEPLARLVRAALRGSGKEAKETAQGYWMLAKDMPRIVKKEK